MTGEFLCERERQGEPCRGASLQRKYGGRHTCNARGWYFWKGGQSEVRGNTDDTVEEEMRAESRANMEMVSDRLNEGIGLALPSQGPLPDILVNEFVGVETCFTLDELNRRLGRVIALLDLVVEELGKGREGG